MSSDTAEKTEIVPLNGITPAELFASPDKVDGILERITSEAKRIPSNLDLSVARNRSTLTSTAFKVVRSKTFLDDIGKSLVVDLKAQVAVIDGERRRIRTALDSLRDEIREPLEAWETQEAARRTEHETAIAAIESFGYFHDRQTREAIEESLEKAEELFKGREWEEFHARAQQAFWGVEKGSREELSRLMFQTELAALREKLQAEIAAERAKIKAERDELNRDRAALLAAIPVTDPLAPAPEPIEEPKPEPIPPPVTRLRNQTELSQSTFIQMAHTISRLITIINKNIHSLPTEDSRTIAGAIELRQIALAEAKRAGILTEES